MIINKIGHEGNSDITWALDEFSLDKINLLVGLNSSGKTTILDTLKSFADAVSKGDEISDVSCFNRPTQLRKDSTSILKKASKEEFSCLALSVLEDVKSVGFDISDFGLYEDGQGGSDLWIVEKGSSRKIIGINVIPSGLFKTLALLIKLKSVERQNCLVLIDDMGQGLDFERSTKLIKLVLKKAEEGLYKQIVMATNDRYVMNCTPLVYWRVLHKEGTHIKVHTHTDNEWLVDSFGLTGLNNFDFFSSGYYCRQYF